MAHISIHVLDISRGRPAAGMAVRLSVVENDTARPIRKAVTNRDGRTDDPLLSGQRLTPGLYELAFGAGEYFSGLGEMLADPPFLGEVVVRFGVSDPFGAYHVPLLLSPYGYSTYRGS